MRPESVCLPCISAFERERRSILLNGCLRPPDALQRARGDDAEKAILRNGHQQQRGEALSVNRSCRLFPCFAHTHTHAAGKRVAFFSAVVPAGCAVGAHSIRAAAGLLTRRRRRRRGREGTSAIYLPCGLLSMVHGLAGEARPGEAAWALGGGDILLVAAGGVSNFGATRMHPSEEESTLEQRYRKQRLYYSFWKIVPFFYQAAGAADAVAKSQRSDTDKEPSKSESIATDCLRLAARSDASIARSLLRQK